MSVEKAYLGSEHVQVSTLSQFKNTRARLTRLSDGTPTYAWVIDINPKRMVVQAVTGSLAMRETYEIALCSNKSSTKFVAEMIGIDHGNSVFLMPDLIRMEAPVENARRRTDVSTATLLNPNAGTTVSVIDVGVNGLGIITEASYDSDTLVELRLNTNLGDIEMVCKVVYSRFEEGGFRTGLQVEKIGRIDQARWNLLLAS